MQRSLGHVPFLLTFALSACANAPLVAPHLGFTPATAATQPVTTHPTNPLTLRISGSATLPRGVQDIADAQDGAISGAAVTITDVLSGKRIGQGVTYYDGSYMADVPGGLGKRPVVVQVMLVDRATKQDLYPLEAALELSPELVEQQADLTPDSTAWVALLCTLANRKTPAGALDWTKLGPGAAASTLGSLIMGSGLDAQAGFALYSEQAQGLTGATSAAQLRAGIEQLVSLLVVKSS